MLLAIAMSEYYRVTHVHYIPPQTNYTKMLTLMKSQDYIKPLGRTNFKLTKKGRDYIKRQDIERFSEVDRAIDNFIDAL